MHALEMDGLWICNSHKKDTAIIWLWRKIISNFSRLALADVFIRTYGALLSWGTMFVSVRAVVRGLSRDAREANSKQLDTRRPHRRTYSICTE